MLQKSFPSKISHSLIIVRYNHFLNPLLYLFVIEQQKKTQENIAANFQSQIKQEGKSGEENITQPTSNSKTV